MKPLLSIQYLRAAAALAVIAYHACQWREGGFEVGRAGVDVFFVISGVIIWRVTAGRDISPLAFLWRRFTRVAPLYWLITLAVAAVAVIWPGFLANVRFGWTHLALSLAFIPHLDSKGLPFPLLPPGWTLCYEAIFYVVFAAALMAPRNRRAAVAAGALCAIVAAGFFLSDPAYILGANPMLLQFAVGVGLSILAEKRVLAGRILGLALIAAGLAAFALPAAAGLFNELWRPLIWGVPAALLVGGALAVETAGAVPSSRTLTVLGDASYSIYLVHLPLVALVAHTLGASNPWLFIPAALAASAAAGLACHFWAEKPLIRLARGVGGGRDPLPTPDRPAPAVSPPPI